MTDNTQFDPKAYDKVRPYFQQIITQFAEAGHSLRDFVDFIIDQFGDTILPYLKRFLAELEQGTVLIGNAGQSVWTLLFGQNISLEQRRQMIEQAAYFRAQQRGFVGGDPVTDWMAAEHEVDAKLANETGLFERGRQTILSLSGAVEKELSELANSVSQWM